MQKPCLTLIWSGINPEDYYTWALEVTPAIIAVAILAFTRSSFPLTCLACILILVHCIILMIGGRYTCAKVPAFGWLS